MNQADYAVWRANFGSTLLLAADGNRDGVVDAADYVVWRDNLGASIAAAAVEAGSAAASTAAAFTADASLATSTEVSPTKASPPRVRFDIWQSPNHGIASPKAHHARRNAHRGEANEIRDTALLAVLDGGATENARNDSGSADMSRPLDRYRWPSERLADSGDDPPIYSLDDLFATLDSMCKIQT